MTSRKESSSNTSKAEFESNKCGGDETLDNELRQAEAQMGVEFGKNDENEESNPGPAEEIISVLDKPSNSTSFISAIMPSE